jgi:hypothetical protein
MNIFFATRWHKIDWTALSLLYKPNLKTMNNLLQTSIQNMTNAEKVVWKANYNFHMRNGVPVAFCEIMANAKIMQKRKLAKTLTFKH